MSYIDGISITKRSARRLLLEKIPGCYVSRVVYSTRFAIFHDDAFEMLGSGETAADAWVSAAKKFADLFSKAQSSADPLKIVTDQMFCSHTHPEFCSHPSVEIDQKEYEKPYPAPLPQDVRDLIAARVAEATTKSHTTEEVVAMMLDASNEVRDLSPGERRAIWQFAEKLHQRLHDHEK